VTTTGARAGWRLRAALGGIASAVLLPAVLLAQVDTAWVRRWDGPTTQTDEAIGMAVDAAGNVYVVGRTDVNPRADSIDWNVVLIKYRPNGDTAWVRTYGAAGDQEPYGVVADAQGNVYVGGSAGASPGANLDYLVLRYDSAGVRRMAQTYNPGSGDDVIRAVALDSGGNLIVTGTDFITIMYRPNGAIVWVRRWEAPPPADPDFAMGVAVDGENNIVVAGYGVGVARMGYDCMLVKYDSAGNELWEAMYDGPAHGGDCVQALALGRTGRSYITGRAASCSGIREDTDWLTICYTPAGETLWVRWYGGAALEWDDPADIAVDSAGNCYVTGYESAIGDTVRCVTVSYDPAGGTRWVRSYDGSGRRHDFGRSIACAADGQVIVALSADGVDPSQQYDIVALGYSGSGDSLWARRYNGPPVYHNDEPVCVASAAGGRVVIAGRTAASSPAYTYDIVTICYEGIGGLAEDVSPSAHATFTVGPSPFCRAALVSGTVLTGEGVVVSISDMAGRLVCRPAVRRSSTSGWAAEWYGVDATGARVAAGVYLVEVRIGGRVERRPVAYCP
jgi:hypothetical protein